MSGKSFSRNGTVGRFSTFSLFRQHSRLIAAQQLVKDLNFSAPERPFALESASSAVKLAFSDQRHQCKSVVSLTALPAVKIHRLNIAQCQSQVVPQYRRLLVIQLSIHHACAPLAIAPWIAYRVSQVRQIAAAGYRCGCQWQISAAEIGGAIRRESR